MRWRITLKQMKGVLKSLVSVFSRNRDGLNPRKIQPSTDTPATSVGTVAIGRKKMVDVHKINRDIELLTPELKEITIEIYELLIWHKIPMKPFETVRSMERQKYLVSLGNSKTLHSRHLPDKDGLSHAVDFVVYINHRWSWDKKYEYYYKMFGGLVSKYPQIQWGGDWQTFKDYPHIQLRSK